MSYELSAAAAAKPRRSQFRYCAARTSRASCRSHIAHLISYLYYGIAAAQLSHSHHSQITFFVPFWQGDYIKHPVLYELSHKYGFTDNLPESALPNRLEEIKEAIRREIRKELKIKEGAEKLRGVATDRKSLSDVQTIVKKSNHKISELKSELLELESQILLTQGNSIHNGQGEWRS